jgi:hypothetical protein
MENLLQKKDFNTVYIINLIGKYIEDIHECHETPKKVKNYLFGTLRMLLNDIDNYELMTKELDNITNAFELGQNAPHSLGYDKFDYLTDNFNEPNFTTIKKNKNEG